MLRAACRQAVVWRETVPGAAELVVSVNVSRRQLEDVAFTDLVAATLECESLPPEALMLELTESAVASGRRAGHPHCSALRALGVRVAVDDFGTGTSSLAELRNLPVDVLKLGKPFVDALETRPGEREFVRVIVELGRVLGLIVAAEGVETEGQLTLLRELGVDVAQGNLWPPPRRRPRSSATCGCHPRSRRRSTLAQVTCTRGPSRPRAGSGGRPWP